MTTLNKLPDDYLKCRKNHLWQDADEDDESLAREYQDSAVIERVPERCPRCTGFKVSIWNYLTGEIITTARRMPEDYSMRGKDQTTRAEQRVELMKRRRGHKQPRVKSKSRRRR